MKPTITITLDATDPVAATIMDILGVKPPTREMPVHERVITALAEGPANKTAVHRRVLADGMGSVTAQSVANALQRLRRDGVVAQDGRRLWHYVAEGGER